VVVVEAGAVVAAVFNRLCKEAGGVRNRRRNEADAGNPGRGRDVAAHYQTHHSIYRKLMALRRCSQCRHARLCRCSRLFNQFNRWRSQ
jgi:hypothetical protein